MLLQFTTFLFRYYRYSFTSYLFILWTNILQMMLVCM